MRFFSISILLLSGCLLSESDGECDPDFEPNSHACRTLVVQTDAVFFADADGGVSEPPVSPASPQLTTCTDRFLGNQRVRLVGGSLGEHHESICQSGSRLSMTRVEWVAPYAGPWRIDTNGSDFDTVLGVRSGSCSAAPVCNDDSGADSASEVRVSAEAGEHFVVVIEGYNGVRGTYALNIQPG